MKMIRIMMLATLVCPLFVGSGLMLFGASETLPFHLFSEADSYEPPPDWLVFCSMLSLAGVSLCAFSRPRQSEWAFKWLFMYGLWCLVLALLELHFEWKRTRNAAAFSQSYWDYRHDYWLQRLLLIYSTLLLGIAQIVAAVLRVEFANLTARKEPSKSGGRQDAATSISEARKP